MHVLPHIVGMMNPGEGKMILATCVPVHRAWCKLCIKALVLKFVPPFYCSHIVVGRLVGQMRVKMFQGRVGALRRAAAEGLFATTQIIIAPPVNSS
jgi:hypothetical protein